MNRGDRGGVISLDKFQASQMLGYSLKNTCKGWPLIRMKVPRSGVGGQLEGGFPDRVVAETQSCHGP